MNYLLAVMTNGRRDYLARTLAALTEHLAPAPALCYLHDDAGGTPYLDLLDQTGYAWKCKAQVSAVGHCRSYRNVWEEAAACGAEFVFVVEDDQVLVRPTDLDDLAWVLHETSSLAQMALLRTPWGAEIPYGGYIPQTPGWYRRRRADNDHLDEWIETTRNWTCAPALFRTSLAREFPWPSDPGCETAIGPAILAARPDAKFGLWGWGEPWVAHIGVERARGAYGY